MDFLCNECAKTFAKEVDLVIHQARAHDKRSFSCKMCHVINVGYTNHNNHMRVHKPKKKTTRLLKCEKCYYETTHKQHLNRHILTVHKKRRKIPTNPRTDLVLTVENLSCNKGILQDTRRYTEKETRTTLLSPQVFSLFDLFPYFLSPPQVRFNSLSRV